MSSKVVKKQLEKLNWAELGSFDSTTNSYIIKKYSKPSYEAGKMYIIRLPESIVNQHNSVLAANWNSGRAPQFSCMKAYVSRIMGKMLYVDSVAYDLENQQDLSLSWSGWLPADEITQISCVEE